MNAFAFINKIFKTGLLFWLFILPFTFSGQQLSIKFIAPQADQMINNGELFMLAIINSNENTEIKKIKVYLDMVDVTSFSKVNNNKVSLLFTELLRSGNHTLLIRVKEKNGKTHESRLSFRTDISAKFKKLTKQKSIGGRLVISSNISNQKGEGISLRQEPKRINSIYFKTELKSNKVSIPIKLFLTDMERFGAQSMNRFTIGVHAKKWALNAGDIYANYHPLILKGARVTGLEANIQLRGLRFSVIHGEINRRREGRLLRYNYTSGLPPLNLRDDSTYVSGGRFKRKLTAANLLFNITDSRNQLFFTLLKSTDDIESVEYAENPGQNLVFGLGYKFKSKSNVLSLEGGMAMSITTSDISNGALSREEIEEVYGIDIPIDPEKYKDIIILNLTTTPLDINNSNYHAYYFKGKVKTKNNYLTTSFRQTGNVYNSYGNPFIQKDRADINVSNYSNFWKRKILLTAQYSYSTNNVSDTQLKTLLYNRYLGRLVFKPSEKWPSLRFGYLINTRSEKDEINNQSQDLANVDNIEAGTDYRFDLKNIKGTISLNYNQVAYKNPLYSLANNETKMVGIGVSGQLYTTYFLSLQYNVLQIDNNASEDNNNQNTYSLRLSHTPNNSKWSASINHRNSRREANGFLLASSRKTTEGRFSYNIRKNLRISLKIGYSDYNEKTHFSNDYQEFFALTKLHYSFHHSK